MPETEPTTQASYAASLFSPRIMDPNSLEHLRLYLEDDQGPRELGGPADPADQHDTLPNSQFFLPGYKNVFGTLKLNGISHVGGHVESAAFHPNPQSSPTKDDNEEYCKREGTLTVTYTPWTALADGRTSAGSRDGREAEGAMADGSTEAESRDVHTAGSEVESAEHPGQDVEVFTQGDGGFEMVPPIEELYDWPESDGEADLMASCQSRSSAERGLIKNRGRINIE